MTAPPAAGVLERIFVAEAGSQAMREVERARALQAKGLEGDRYATGRGYWVPHDVCQVTLIGAEGLDAVERDMGLAVSAGQHRRNLVVRGLDPQGLGGQRFRIGEVTFAYDRPRPPCAHVAALTDRRMTKALFRHGFGICAVIETDGWLQRGDPVEVLGPNQDLFSGSFERFLRAFRFG